MSNEEKIRDIHKSIENGNYKLWHEDEKLKELEWKKILLQHILNVTYGGITTAKPNEEQLAKILKDYQEVKEQLKNYHQN